MDEMVELIEEEQNKLAKLEMRYVAISKSETINHSLTHSLTGVGAKRWYRI